MAAKFEDILIKLTSGPWNWITYIFCSLWGLFGAMQAFASAFLSPVTDHWCHIEQLVKLNWTKEQIWNYSIPWDDEMNQHSQCKMYNRNYSNLEGISPWNHDIWNEEEDIIPCSKWDYDTQQFYSTIVSEWDLVCNNSFLRSLNQSLFMVGILFGGPIGGIMADKIGRKSLMTKSLVIFLLVSIVATFSTSYPVFLISRTLMAVAGNCVYETSYILAVESCTPRDRSIVGIMFSVPFGLGSILLSGIAYLIRDWRILHLVISLPVASLIASFIVLPESPRWLIQRGQIDVASKEIEKAAKWNKVQNWDSIWLNQTLQEIDLSIKEETNSLKERMFNCEIFRSSFLCKIFLLVGIQWAICTLVYYGLSLNAQNFNADPFFFILISGLVELPAYILIVPLVIKYGRKITLILFFSITSFTILLQTIPFTENMSEWWTYTLTMVAKLTITSAFQVLILFCSELFPTSIRTQGLGITSMVGRTGAIFSPFVNDLLGGYNKNIPNFIYGGCSLLALLMVFSLPETNNKPLLETVQDMKHKRLKGKSRPKAQCELDDIEETENKLIEERE